MDGPSRFAAVRALFMRVADLPAAERAAALAAEPDAGIRDEVRYLLVADEAEFELDLSQRASEALGVPEWIGPYRVVREVGRGAMGVVYEAEEASPRRRVALKVVHPWLRTPALDALARREAQAMADVVHPGIPSIYALVDVGGAPVVAMELVEGRKITEHAADLPQAARLDLLARTCDAVACAHRAGIAHRDLKPSNILVTAEGQPKVLDFGIAGHADRPAPAGSGTERYMAPEQRAGAPGTPAGDVYALGVVILEVLAAPEPIGDGPPADAAPLRRAREDLRAVLVRALSPRPGDRYADAAGLAEELRRVRRNQPVDALGRTWGARARAAARRHPARAVAAAALLVAGVGVGIGWGAIRARVEDALAEDRLARLMRDPRGFADPDVRAALDTLLHDPHFASAPAATRAWAWKAGHLDGAERLQGLANAWIFANPHDVAGAADALGLALFAAGEDEVAAALGPFDAPSARAARALALHDLGSADLPPGADRLLGPLSQAEPGDAVSAGALFSGERLSARDRTLTLSRDGEAVRAWDIPGEAGQVRTDGRSVLAWGQDWVAWGGIGDAALAVSRDGPLSAAIFPADPAGGMGILAVRRWERPGLYGVSTEGEVGLDADANARELPTLDLASADLDGDGRAEVIVAATGWKGHELRVLSGPSDDLHLVARLRLAAWAVAVANGRIYVLGGAIPVEASPHGTRTSVVPVRLSDGRLVPEPAIEVGFDAFGLAAADVDGDGRKELLAYTEDRVGIVDPSGAVPPLVLPGFGFVAAGEADADPADELWVRDGERTWVLGAGHAGLPARQPGAPPPEEAPDAIRPPPLRDAWGRAALLATLGHPDLAEQALLTLVEAADRAPLAVTRALTLLADGASESAAVGLAEHALDAGPGAREAATALLRQAHAFDGEAATRVAPSLSERESLTFAGPLPVSAGVATVGVVRRNPLRARLELTLRGDTGLALALPLSWSGDAACVEVALDLREVDWAAGLALTLRQGDHAEAANLWRVGGGPRSGHSLSFSVRGAGPPGRSPALDGDHRASMCLTARPARVSVRLDDTPRLVAPIDWVPEAGAFRLELGSARGPYPPDRTARIDVLGITLRGARFLADPDPTSDRARRAAEGDVATLEALRTSGTPWERALADEALDRESPASLAGLSVAELRALLRRDPHAWGALVRTAVGARFPELWAEAWQIPLVYEDPWVFAAVLDPSLQGIGTDTPPTQRVGLLRARALLESGRVAAASATLERLREAMPEAWLTTARLEARQGHPDDARAALRTWLSRAPSAAAARDGVVDDPELAALLPDLTGDPVLR